MVEEAKWTEATVHDGTQHGLDEGSSDDMKRDPIGAFAREIIQNSYDAGLRDKDGDIKKVCVNFDQEAVSTDNIPKFEWIYQEIRHIYYYLKKEKPKSRDIAFYEKAFNNLTDKNVIPVMRVFDRGTTGLTPDRYEHFIKEMGDSNKNEGTAGYNGVGKKTIYKTSDIRTLFVSSETEDGERFHVGVTKQRTHIKPDDPTATATGNGYYELNGGPVPGLLKLPPFKEEPAGSGTSIYILGFKEGKDAPNRILAEALNSFLIPIYEGRLEVIVFGKTLNKDTLDAILSDIETGGAFYDKKKKLSNIYAMLDTIRSFDEGDKHAERYELFDGKASLTIKKYSGSNDLAKNKVFYFKNPSMRTVIKECSYMTPYNAILEINNTRLSEIHSWIENDTHTAFIPSKLEERNKEEATEGRTAYERLDEELEKTLTKALTPDNIEECDIKGADKYLASVTGSDGEDKRDQIIATVSKAEKTIRSFRPSNKDDEGESAPHVPRKHPTPIGPDEPKDPEERNKTLTNKERVTDTGKEDSHVKLPEDALNYIYLGPDERNICALELTVKEDVESGELIIKEVGEGRNDSFKIDVFWITVNGDYRNVTPSGSITPFSCKKGEVIDVEFMPQRKNIDCVGVSVISHKKGRSVNNE